MSFCFGAVVWAPRRDGRPRDAHEARIRSDRHLVRGEARYRPRVRSGVFNDPLEAAAQAHLTWTPSLVRAFICLVNTGEWVAGSPLNALAVQPPFKECHFIDADGNRAAQLKELSGNRPEVFTYEGDCNEILPSRIFPRAEYSKYGRALCLLDPYNIDLAWDVVAAAGKMGTIEIFLNFMIMDMNMNVLLHDPEKVDPRQVARMSRFLGR